MVSKINEKKIALYGHGSGFPREKEMNTVYIKNLKLSLKHQLEIGG
jgi:hypothetical protein